MPELPEVESARATIERGGLHRRIGAVDDADRYECRPHPAGEIAEALVGRELTGAFRRGKSMWCETSGRGRSRTPGPVLGLHLGMAGRILITGPEGQLTEGGDWLGGRYGSAAEQADRKPEWDRFTITFTDGGSLRLFDKRRLGRVRLDPDLDALGPDAEQVRLPEFLAAVHGSSEHGSRAPIKARLLDQSVIAGVGNLLADQTLWQAEIDPRHPTDELSRDELKRLHHELHRATKAAIRHGGVHTGSFIEHRTPGGRCPRCGAALERATVGTRTTWWCPAEQT